MLEDLSSIFNYVDFNIKDFPTFINNKKILITGSWFYRVIWLLSCAG